jgi:hypothetical protein
MCLRVSYKKKYEKKTNNFVASVKSLKKGVGSGVRSRSGSINQRYGFADPDLIKMSQIPNTAFKAFGSFRRLL